MPKLRATSSIYVGSLAVEQNMAKLVEIQPIYGWVTLGTFKITYATSLQFLLKRLFYTVHVTMFVTAVVSLGHISLHRSYTPLEHSGA